MVISLLSNAVKFTDEGSVSVSVSLSEQGSRERGSGGESQRQRTDASAVGASFDTPQTSSGATQDERSRGAVDHLVVSVSDTGKGIPEAEIPTLFDEYRQAKGQSESDVQKGTGLGLSITKKFAELFGGRDQRGVGDGRGVEVYGADSGDVSGMMGHGLYVRAGGRTDKGWVCPADRMA